MPEKHRGWFREFGGRPFPPALVEAAAEELETLCDVLRAEGVTVVRPDPIDWTAPFGSPDFGASRGLYGAMPRDILLVVGDEIIEAPMAWPSRAFESRAYRRLIKGYFRGGARWTAAPSPQRAADLYAPHNRARGFDVQAGGSVVTEFEPARVEGRDVLIGSQRMMHAEGLAECAALRRAAEAAHRVGGTLVYVAIDGALVGAIDRLGIALSFAPGDWIVSDISARFTPAGFDALLTEAGFAPATFFTEPTGRMALALAERA